MFTYWSAWVLISGNCLPALASALGSIAAKNLRWLAGIATEQLMETIGFLFVHETKRPCTRAFANLAISV